MHLDLNYYICKTSDNKTVLGSNILSAVKYKCKVQVMMFTQFIGLGFMTEYVGGGSAATFQKTWLHSKKGGAEEVRFCEKRPSQHEPSTFAMKVF